MKLTYNQVSAWSWLDSVWNQVVGPYNTVDCIVYSNVDFEVDSSWAPFTFLDADWLRLGWLLELLLLIPIQLCNQVNFTAGLVVNFQVWLRCIVKIHLVNIQSLNISSLNWVMWPISDWTWRLALVLRATRLFSSTDIQLCNQLWMSNLSIWWSTSKSTWDTFLLSYELISSDFKWLGRLRQSWCQVCYLFHSRLPSLRQLGQIVISWHSLELIDSCCKLLNLFHGFHVIYVNTFRVDFIIYFTIVFQVSGKRLFQRA